MTSEELTKHIDGIEGRLGAIIRIAVSEEGTIRVVLREHTKGFSRTRYERVLSTNGFKSKTKLSPIEHKEEPTHVVLSDYAQPVVINLDSTPQDQVPEDFHKVVNLLVANYTVADIAGAYVNAMSGDRYRSLLDRVRRL